MTDPDPKAGPWRDELPALDTLLNSAELDAPPPGLEARLLRRLREAEPFEPAPVSPEAGEVPRGPAAVAAEPLRMPSMKRTGLRAPLLWLGLVAAAVGGLALRDARDTGGDSGQTNGGRSSELPLHGMASRDGPAACTGTYFIRESDGSESLWTFHPDGTLLSTSHAERDQRLSTQHGSWKAAGPLTARALQLGLRVTARGALAGVERVDSMIRGENGSCQTVAGESSRQWFAPGQDFLHPDDRAGNPARFTGFRVDVTP